ncbi:hypothetical protein CERSUDRAFT_98803 [Gelatoporia subvermispora B]|uniref:DUF6532 domain-containing protein n=1 Tax=Ceriporiopsis subvermispora (strain B) TaxID=914234 RepID=M2R2T7_CERS8|nr:hypothetical protein CERSUDRAFT_98803 [Gelatoporia subvermispora B]
MAAGMVLDPHLRFVPPPVPLRRSSGDGRSLSDATSTTSLVPLTAALTPVYRTPQALSLVPHDSLPPPPSQNYYPRASQSGEGAGLPDADTEGETSVTDDTAALSANVAGSGSMFQSRRPTLTMLTNGTMSRDQADEHSRTAGMVRKRQNGSRSVSTSPTESASTQTGDEFGSDDDSDGSVSDACPRKKGRDRSARGLANYRLEIINVAYKHFKLLIATSCAWPTDDKKDIYIIESWQVACEEGDWDITRDARLRINEKERRLICDRKCQVCGDMKKAAKCFLPARYGFRPAQNTDPEIADIKEHNRELVGRLLNKIVFAHPEPGNPADFCRNPIITDVISRVFFEQTRNNRTTNLGIKYAEYFEDAMPLPTIALALTAICCAIDEWKEGIEEPIHFTETPYRKHYESYVKTLQTWEDYAVKKPLNAFKRLQQDLLRTCRANAGTSDAMQAEADGAGAAVESLLGEEDFAQWS